MDRFVLDFQLPAVGFADLLGHHNVIAVGVGAGDIGDGHSAVGVVILHPVVGSVSTFHTNGQNTVFHTGLRLFTAAGGHGQQHHQGNHDTQDLLHFCYLTIFVLGSFPLPREIKIGPLC